MCRVVLAVALSGAFGGFVAGEALAADIPTKAPPMTVTSGPWINPFGGFAVDDSGWFGDIGAVAAINGNLNTAGWLVRVRGGGGHYEYNRTPALVQGVDYQVGDFMLGYQWISGPTRFSFYAGANVEHHDNNDPLATVAGTEWGFKVQGEVFTNFAPNWYGLVLATYSTAFDSYFALGKIGYNVNSFVSIGPEVVAMGNERFDAVRTGPFVAFNVTPATMIIVSGGYSWDTNSTALNDNSGGYGTVHVRSLF
jgi:hypothetical protein